MMPPGTRVKTECPILFQDPWLLIVHKLEGVLSHPNVQGRQARDSGKKHSRVAFEGPYDFDKRCFQTPDGPVWLIHRLDQDTSGILMAALDADTAQKCRSAFDKGTVRKWYRALLCGRLTASGMWTDHLAVKRQTRFVRTIVLRGKSPNAKLRYQVCRFFPREGLSLVEMELLSGKTHQIRVQAAFRHHPVIGDDIYGNFALNKKLAKSLGMRRLFLHACAVEMSHPVTGKKLRIEDPLPASLAPAIHRMSDAVN